MIKIIDGLLIGSIILCTFGGYIIADTMAKPNKTTLYCINNKIYEKYEDKFYKPHYNAKTGLAEMCVEIDSK